MAKVTGIGGVFFKAKDTKKLAAWYAEHLGLELEDFGGAIFRWTDDKANDDGLTVWHLSESSSEWFSPSASSFMFNYRVDDMEGMLEQLTGAGVEILKGPEHHENGAFAWALCSEAQKPAPGLLDQTSAEKPARSPHPGYSIKRVSAGPTERDAKSLGDAHGRR